MALRRSPLNLIAVLLEVGFGVSRQSHRCAVMVFICSAASGADEPAASSGLARLCQLAMVGKGQKQTGRKISFF